MSEELSLCAQEVRKNDHDQFLCSLFIPQEYRQAFWALSLFQIETLRIRDAVSEPHLGLIRLQFWRDAFQAKYENTSSMQELGTHKELLESLDVKMIDHELLDQYLNARSFDMEDLPHDDLNALVNYQSATLGSICALKCQAMGLKDHSETIEAAKKIGAALGLTMIVRTMAYQGRSQRIKIPLSLVKKHLLDLKTIHKTEFTPELGAICREICDQAKSLIIDARTLDVDKSALGVLLISVSIEDYIKRISKRKFNPFDPNIGSGQLSRQLKMAYRAALKRF